MLILILFTQLVFAQEVCIVKSRSGAHLGEFNGVCDRKNVPRAEWADRMNVELFQDKEAERKNAIDAKLREAVQNETGVLKDVLETQYGNKQSLIPLDDLLPLPIPIPEPTCGLPHLPPCSVENAKFKTQKVKQKRKRL